MSNALSLKSSPNTQQREQQIDRQRNHGQRSEVNSSPLGLRKRLKIHISFLRSFHLSRILNIVFCSFVIFSSTIRQAAPLPVLVHQYITCPRGQEKKKKKKCSPPFQWDLYKWQKMVKMDCDDTGMSSMQNCFPTYCEAVCILSESERQSLEKKGKKRRGISLERNHGKIFALVLMHWILSGEHLTSK